MFKKHILLLLVLVLSIGLFAACGNTEGVEGDAEGNGAPVGDVVKVGWLAPLTGPDAGEGTAARDAFILAFQQLNESGELPYTVEVVSMDDASLPETGMSAAQKLVADPALVAAGGHWNSPVVDATIPIFKQAGVPFTIWCSIRASLTDGTHYPYLTRIGPTAEQENIPCAEVVFKDLGYENVFIVSDVSSYGKANNAALTAEANKHGAEIVGMEEVQVGTTDFRPILSKVQAANAQTVYWGGVSQEGALLKRQAYELGMDDVLFWGISGMTTVDYIIAASDEAAEGAFGTAPFYDLEASEVSRHFVETFNNAYPNVALQAYTAHGYDTALAIITAMKSIDGIPTREQMVMAVANVEFDGALGHTRFDDNGQTENVSGFIAVVAQDGAWVHYDKSEYAPGGSRTLPKK